MTETALAVVDGKIEVSPASKDTEQVKLVWTIRDSAQKEVAIFRQQNKIPKGRLSGRWGTIAFDIVLAMRGQILEAMRRLETSGTIACRFHPTSNSPYLDNFCGPDRRRLQDVTPLL